MSVLPQSRRNPTYTPSDGPRRIEVVIESRRELGFESLDEIRKRGIAGREARAQFAEAAHAFGRAGERLVVEVDGLPIMRLPEQEAHRGRVDVDVAATAIAATRTDACRVAVGREVMIVNSPEWLHEVLVAKAKSFEKSPILRTALEPLAGTDASGAELRSLDAEQVMALPPAMVLTGQAPLVDDVVPMSVAQAFEAGEEADIPYLTGMFPGRANIPGYRWFDRERYPSYVAHQRRLAVLGFLIVLIVLFFVVEIAGHS